MVSTLPLISSSLVFFRPLGTVPKLPTIDITITFMLTTTTFKLIIYLYMSCNKTDKKIHEIAFLFLCRLINFFNIN